MHTSSLRAFRSAALSLQKSQIALRPGRFFHSSPAARAADDSNRGSRDDGNNPDKESGSGEGDNGDSNLFGDLSTAALGEAQDRRRAGNGSLRSRTLRNRKPGELPPVQLPKEFLSGAVCRFQGAKPNTDLDLGILSQGKGPHIILKDTMLYRPPDSRSEEHNTSLFDAAAWTQESLDEAIRGLKSNPDKTSIHRRGDAFVAASFWAVARLIGKVYGEDAALKLLESGSIPASPDLLAALLHAKLAHDDSSFTPSQAKQMIADLTGNVGIEASAVGLYADELIEEVVTSVNADFVVRAPKNVKVTDLRRPITIINTPDCSGYSVPRDIVQHVASRLGADVLHLRASDIAYIVGNYLGQDAARAPGAISHLGYKAAENSGRLGVRRANDMDGDEPEDTTVPYTVVLRSEKFKRDNKKYVSLMDEFLNGTNRGKNDEIWEDLKVNAVLEELVHSADSESAEQTPLIVHIDDFNALSMDLECGSMIIGKIRKVVDGLWADGRTIALVGSCSAKGVPKPYLNGLRELESTERVLTLRADSLSKIELSLIKSWETRNYLMENRENIERMLMSMVDPAFGITSMEEIDANKVPDPWKNSILPLAEVYRIATMIIGGSEGPADVFNTESVEKVAQGIKRLDQLKEALFKIKKPFDDKNQRMESRRFTDVHKLNPSEEDHEERLKSGLINAEDIRTTFNDVHAPNETIESVKMLTTLSLIRPEAFSYGVLATDRIPGCLLYGPPGTGKTLLAKAVAKESGANMIEISGASINNMFVGESEKNVRALFSLAKKKEPMVIFIDEADALLGSRGRRDLGARRETINQFLGEWDGMDNMKAFIMVATNRPFDLDEAVLRRLPRKLLIDLPLEQDRAAILRIHLKNEVLEQSLSLDEIARRTPLYSGSDLKNVCVAAAMAAVKEELELELQQKASGQTPQETTAMKKRVLGQRHFDKALREIGASVSEDMATLTAIRKFDEKYGDGGAGRRKKRGMGFEIAGEADKNRDADAGSREARVRSA
ncbi:hypothetical protein AAE478_006240 [Parahypoxylon ruwenzoriense]